MTRTSYCCNVNELGEKMDLTTFLTIVALIHAALYFTDQFLKVSKFRPNLFLPKSLIINQCETL